MRCHDASKASSNRRARWRGYRGNVAVRRNPDSIIAARVERQNHPLMIRLH
jgi:hypothetical protein